MANRPAFNKPFHQLSPQERSYYIDWVDQHYRAFFVGDVPRPGPRPVYPELIRANKAYNWRSPETAEYLGTCLLYTSPSPRDVEESRMPSSA